MTLPHGILPLQLSAWQQGSDAGKAGLQSIDCPYTPDNYDFVVWHNGWSFTRHLRARDLARFETPFKDDEEI